MKIKIIRERSADFNADGTINRIDGLLRCECGRLVVLDDCMTNSCTNCGNDYDGNGSLLADRRYWGEETGETYADITTPDSRNDDIW